MFFVRYPEVGTQVFRKTQTAFRIALVAFSGLALRELRSFSNWVFINIYSWVPWYWPLPQRWSQIFGRILTFDKKEAKTYYVNQQDYDAYRRMRQNHFTVGYYSRNSERYLQYPAFAQRRTALGDWVRAENYQIGTERVLSRHKDIFRTLFQGDDVYDALRVMDKYNIH
jgi:hypothetical protein